jgi:hypothetical protein
MVSIRIPRKTIKVAGPSVLWVANGIPNNWKISITMARARARARARALDPSSVLGAPRKRKSSR